MEHTWRKVLTGIGAAIAIGAGAPQAFGQESDSPEFQVLEVSSADEYVVFVNMTTAEVDLSGWTVDFEYGSGGSSEQGTIPNGTTVGARDTIKIASGAGETSGDVVVIEDPFDEKVIDTSGSDVIALLDADGNEVVNSKDDLFGSGGGGDDGGDDTTTDEETTTEEGTTSTEEESTSDDGTDQSDSDESDDTTEDGSSGSDGGSGQMSSEFESDSKPDESSDDDC